MWPVAIYLMIGLVLVFCWWVPSKSALVDHASYFIAGFVLAVLWFPVLLGIAWFTWKDRRGGRHGRT